MIDGFLTLQLQENLFQGCPANLIINNPLQETALEVAEQICTTETPRAETQTGVINSNIHITDLHNLKAQSIVFIRGKE